MNDVIIVAFDDLARARLGMSELRRLDADEVISIRSAAVTVREPDGRFWIAEDEEYAGIGGTVAGGAVGALLGALVGPLGVLLWGAVGAVVGSLKDSADAEATEDVLAAVAASVGPGTTAIVADVHEPTTRIVDAVMTDAGGTVARRLRADVLAELATADAASHADRAPAAGGDGPARRSESVGTEAG